MAKILEVAQRISDATGVRRESVELVCRKLGEAGLGPPRGRGANAPHYQALHLAYVLVGVMLTSDAVTHAVIRVAQAVQRARTLGSGGITLRVMVTGEGDEQQTWAVQGGSFVRNLADLIGSIGNVLQSGEQPDPREWPSAVGITFRGEEIQGWMELPLKGTVPEGISQSRRVAFGPAMTSSVGLSREVRVDPGALTTIARLMPGPHESHRDLMRAFFEKQAPLADGAQSRRREKGR
jgi:hypothetical protein